MLIIGYGNTLRGDDGIGCVAAEELSKKVKDKRIQVVSCQQLTPELAKDVSEADRVILIDAMRGKPSGHLVMRRISPGDVQPTFTHELRPESLLACSRELYGACPETFLVSITGHSFKLGEEISQQLIGLLPKLNRYVLKLANVH